VISLSDYYMGRDAKYPNELTDELKWNAASTVDRVNQLLEAFGEHRNVNSGWRPQAINAGVPNAAAKSKHMTCQACDLSDDDGTLDAWCLANPEALERIGLWQEDPGSTPRWAHVQIIPPASGKRVFRP
jgi:Peptidase M15